MVQCKRFVTTVALNVQSSLNRKQMLLILKLSLVDIFFLKFSILKTNFFLTVLKFVHILNFCKITLSIIVFSTTWQVENV